MSLYDSLVDVLTNPKHTRWIVPLLIVAEAVLCGLIIWRVPYTEIDFRTYIAQLRLFQAGERHYSKITGPTGPLVYPALHVYLYNFVSEVARYGQKEEDIQRAQIIFGLFYLATLSLVFACYRRANAPPWLLAPLVLSKRLHSIFLLRMFNDGPAAAVGLWACIYLLQRRSWVAGALVWSAGLGIKMTVLLGGPGLAMVMIQGAGLSRATGTAFWVVAVQVLIATPFLSAGDAAAWEYFRCAFDFGRKFLFKWTVNWRFVGEEVFVSERFAISLLVLHLSLLLVLLQTQWVRPSSRSLPGFVNWLAGPADLVRRADISRRVTPTFVMDTLLSSMVVGLLCARSLHYQFYAYLGWATPYLLWRTGGGPVWVLVNWAVQEYCWLVFPSTNVSSMLVVFQLALQVLSAIMAAPDVHAGRQQLKAKAG